MIQLANSGHPVAEIADAVGVSRQRIHQILQEKK